MKNIVHSAFPLSYILKTLQVLVQEIMPSFHSRPFEKIEFLSTMALQWGEWQSMGIFYFQNVPNKLEIILNAICQRVNILEIWRNKKEYAKVGWSNGSNGSSYNRKRCKIKLDFSLNLHQAWDQLELHVNNFIKVEPLISISDSCISNWIFMISPEASGSCLL